MRAQYIKRLLFAGFLAIAVAGFSAHPEASGTLSGKQVAEKIFVITAGKHKFHTIYGVANSHIIETANGLRLIDATLTFSGARRIKKYIGQLGKPLVQVILSHNHPDHWFGAQMFASDAPIATSRNIRNDLKKGGMRYIKILKKRLKENMPDKVIVPTAQIALGKQNWDGLEVVVEEYSEQESHHSLLIKIPAYGIMIGQDLFYNNMFLVASERKRNENWRKLLAGFLTKEAKRYKTLLVGHGMNGGPSILTQDIKYLDALEAVLKMNLTQEQTRQRLIEMFPEKGGKGMLGISMRNLFRGH